MQIFAPALPLGGDRPAVLVLRARVRACVCVFKKIVCVCLKRFAKKKQRFVIEHKEYLGKS